MNACCCGGALAGHSAGHCGAHPDVDADADDEVDDDVDAGAGADVDIHGDAFAAGEEESDKAEGTPREIAAEPGEHHSVTASAVECMRISCSAPYALWLTHTCWRHLSGKDGSFLAQHGCSRMSCQCVQLGLWGVTQLLASPSTYQNYVDFPSVGFDQCSFANFCACLELQSPVDAVQISNNAMLCLLQARQLQVSPRHAQHAPWWPLLFSPAVAARGRLPC